ncbi:MAG: putative selenate ABC transporter substrate-binding protein [Alphaproteobacteria bacterium]
MIRRVCHTLSIFLSLMVTAAAIQAAKAAEAREFVFTAIPDEDESRLRQRFDMVAAYLSRELGVKSRFIPVKSYAAAVTAFRNNQVQLAWFGGLSGVRARRLVPGSQALAQGFEDKSFVTYFIAHKLSGLKPGVGFPMGVAGKTFTFGSKGSTSGRLMPEFHIRKHFNKAPNQVFSRVGFSGDHSRTIALVQSGAYMAGAVNFKVWENEMRAGHIDKSKIAVIWKTPPYPDYHWTIRGDVEKTFGAGFNRRVKQALLALKDPKLLASFPRKRFIPANNSDFDPILRVGKSIGLID